uniref:Putative chaperone n=1 Tax=viral metagenome TaxID=1070528 RepID=A0A6M3L1J3_9ZZZZ
MEERNPYKILGVKKKSTPEEIKKAYYKLAKKHHPDHGGDEEIFKEIQWAFNILNDVNKRNYFDEHGFIPGSEEERIYQSIVNVMKIHIFDQINNERKIDIELLQRGLAKKIEDMEKEIISIKRIIKIINRNTNAVSIKKGNNIKLNCFESAIESLLSDAQSQLDGKESDLKFKKKQYEILMKFETINKSSNNPILRIKFMSSSSTTSYSI